MYFDLTKFPIAENGEQCKGPEGKPIDYQGVFIQALIGDVDEQGNPIKGEDKYKRYDMYTKIKRTPTPSMVPLTAEDIVYIKKCCLMFASIIAGQCRDFLSAPIPDVIVNEPTK
jgi:hypothetical protein